MLPIALAAAVAVPIGAGAWAAEPVTPMPDALQTYWDGPTLNLNWLGGIYNTYSGTFVGTPISVPGDQAWRTLKVKNAGPCTGIVTVEALNVQANFPLDTVNAVLPEIIDLGWDVNGTKGVATWAQLIAAGGSRTLGTFSLPQGAEAPLGMGYRFPYDETRGRNLGWPSTELTFDVTITITGDTACIPYSGSATPPPNTGKGSQSPNRSSLSPDKPGMHPHTGTMILGVMFLAGSLLLLGALLRRRRREEEEQMVPRHASP